MGPYLRGTSRFSSVVLLCVPIYAERSDFHEFKVVLPGIPIFMSSKYCCHPLSHKAGELDKKSGAPNFKSEHKTTVNPITMELVYNGIQF